MNSEVMVSIPLAALFVGAFVGVGGCVLRRTGMINRPGQALAMAPVAAAIGFAAFSYLGYLVIGLRAATPGVVTSMLVAGVLSGYGYWIALADDLRETRRVIGRDIVSPVPLMFAVLSVGFLLIAATHWLTPPREGDALRGYLFTARWLRDRGFAYSPYNTVYQLYPFNTEIVFALTLAYGNDIVLKAVDGAMGMCLLGALYELARRFTDRLSSFYAPAHLAVMTAFTGVWASGKVDVLTTLTFVSGISLLFRPSEPVTWRVIALSAFLVGTACAQKYTVWVFAAAYVVSLALLAPAPLKKRLAWSTGAALVMFVCLVPHFTKTILWTGNPVAPFARTIFPSRGVYLNPNDHSDAVPMVRADLARLPQKLFFDGVDRRRLGPFPLLILIGLPLCFLRNTPVAVRRLMAVAAVLVAAWVAVRRGESLEARFLLIPTAILCVAAAVGVGQMSRSRGLRWSLIALTAFTIGYSGIWQNRDWRRSWPYILGYEDLAAWHDRITPARSYSALTRVSQHLREDRRLFLYAGLYYIPDDKLEYIATEQEVAAFFGMPQNERRQFLERHCFGYVHMFGKVRYNPDWTRDLPIVAQWKDMANGLEYTLFKLHSNCGRQDSSLQHGAARLRTSN